jgi:hypothetical protein
VLLTTLHQPFLTPDSMWVEKPQLFFKSTLLPPKLTKGCYSSYSEDIYLKIDS